MRTGESIAKTGAQETKVPAHDGVTLQVSTRGAGPAVVMIAGGPGCVHYLDTDDAAPPGFRVFCPEPRGVGRSAGGPHDVGQAIDDLEAIRECAGLTRWQVIGHSWGADLGLAYALDHPESVSGLVSVAGTGIQNDRNWRDTYVRLLDTEPMPDIAFDTDVHRRLIDDWRENWITAPDLLVRLRDLTVPVEFVLAGDDIRPPWPIEQLAALMPTASLRRVERAPHNFWYTDPPRWRRVLATSLADSGCPPTRAGPEC